MKPKTTNLLYWIFTGLFAALMIQSAIPDALLTSDAIKFTHDYLGYPVYFIQFIGVAKILGSAAILIPGFNKIKEWAYAGLFFDLVAVIYSGIAAAKGVVDPRMVWMLIWIVPGILSYYFWNKLQRLQVNQ